MKWPVFVFLVLQFVAADSVQAVTTTANDLLGGLTSYVFRGYENLYDSSGSLVTSRVPQAGDSLQGVFVITQVSNQYGTAIYAPQLGVELTGVFDQTIAGTDSAGDFILTPDATLTTSGGSRGKAMSGAAFQAAYGAGAMIAFYSNNSNAMPIGQNGNGLVGLSTSNAIALATTGTRWASFGASGTWAHSNGYYYTSRESMPGVSSFAASLGFVNNLTGIPISTFLPISSTPPTGLPAVANPFIVQGSTFPSDANLNNTAYTVFATDPEQLNCPGYWSSAVSGNWTDASKWGLGVPNGIGFGAALNASTTAAVTVTLNTPVTLGALVLGNSASSTTGYILAGAGSNRLTLNNSGSGAAIILSGGSQTINAPVVLADNLTVNGSGTLDFGSASSITPSGGYSLTLNAASATLILSGSDNLSAMFVAAGKLLVTNPAAIAGGSALTVGNSLPFHAPMVETVAAATPVPEPGTLTLAAVALFGLFSVTNGPLRRYLLGGTRRKGLLRWRIRARDGSGC